MPHAVITAGVKGLGKMISEAFLENGYDVTVQYRSNDGTVEKLKEEWINYETNVQFVNGDIEQKDDIHKLAEEAQKFRPTIDVLVCNAGPYIFERKKLIEYDDEEWDRMVNGNLSSAFYLFQAFIPIMRKQQFGRIITFGFQESNQTPAWKYRSAFAAAKTGLTSLTKTVSIEEAENGITANMICPGKITGDMKEASIEAGKLQLDSETPVGRPGTGGDIARTVLFLADQQADLITGAVIEVTGGVDVLHRYR
ncbi:SDR family oxidoreductase [Salisediminibacterium halotolerans]|uniref:SDR family oxidoreductase n=1 Tax=Salisediminibacterium halotolerans TaxID=517425 RepID=UPI000EAD2B6E|nr:SDR family oxidoreductase [Salisediminibacterium halotolerans]RLJ69362.1 3-oxoacyl-[acyl-carrier protein] reductase [Actinophytocola xinjiangensis]RPE84012.1 3-oxoacyl-[acyl-carrier protein] reductase [Salisediminibacterium halotolerans]TWG32437.1 3-oxoacyl-[acyl-carrier protein] reductase [Salisediminibacterium halotolerans]GEL07345.1 3-ketoacyl-ACP reductase [Salisediminibacterium halotolerans]